MGWLAAAAVALMLPAAGEAQQPKTLRVVMHSDLKNLDPIWTSAFIVRNHGYMVYDTLFAKDEKLQIQPQMVDDPRGDERAFFSAIPYIQPGT